jgi:hypothetical protein
MSWRAMYVMGPLSLLLVGAVVTAGGCRHGGRDTIAVQPFRDETDPDDGFQFYESAVPAGADGSAKSSGESATETTVEVEIDDDSGEGSETAAAAGEDDDEASDGDDDEAGDDGDDGGDGGEDTAGGDGDEDTAHGEAGHGHLEPSSTPPQGR